MAMKARDVLERRIRSGNYLLATIPAERQLADEIGVSRMTARKAVQALVDDGLLARDGNGRIVVGDSARPGLTVGFLVPSLGSPDVDAWRRAMAATAASFAAAVHPIVYLHWDDPVIAQALAACDAVFLYPSAEPIPAHVTARLRGAGKPVVALEQDLTAFGIPSVRVFPAGFVHRLLDVLADLGHRACDCFSVQTPGVVIESRIAQWNLWRAHRRFAGRLLGRPIQPYASPLAQARAEMGRVIDAGEPLATSLFCTTAPAAIGAVRALHDRGRRVGRDVSVCVFNDEELAQYTVPSLTCVRRPDVGPYLSVCFEWMRRGGQDWIGPLLLEPEQVDLFRGESTGEAPGRADRPSDRN
jgi:DNA-binding LacI/PurR family transcriptional regulator